MAAKTEWRQGEFLVSIDKNLFQPAAINAAYATDYIYWAQPVEETQLKKMLENSLSFGLYAVTGSDATGSTDLQQIGLARLITDQVSFAYLTDVYILEEYQGKGLGTFLMDCLNETLLSWPDLRGTFLMTSGTDFYVKKLGMVEFEPAKHNIKWMVKKGPRYSLD